MSRPPKVALVCDWLTDVGGAELVLLELHKMFPEAPIYTSQYDPKKIDWFKGADVRTGWLQKLPSSLKKLLPVLRAVYFSHLKLDEYDLVISSNTGAECKGIKLRSDQTHLCYMHAPTHYYWDRYETYLKNPGWGIFNWVGRWGLKLLIKPMRKWDYRAAQRPSKIVTNSTYTQHAIKKHYGRDSDVVHPPVDTTYFKPNKNTERNGFVITGRQTPYKRFDIAVQACTKLNLPLRVIGDGPEHKRLKARSGPSVTFLGHIPRSQIRDELQSAEAFLFPGVDDFGIAAVEALASGCPVIAYKDGGALDYIVPQKTGEFFHPQTSAALESSLQAFGKLSFDEPTLLEKAREFSRDAFITKMKTLI